MSRFSSMKSSEIKKMVLEYAIHHNCWKTFDALYSDHRKLEVSQLTLVLFAIHRVIHEDQVDKYEVAIGVLYKIYTKFGEKFGCPFKAYWKLVLAMKIKVFFHSLQKSCKEEILEKLKNLIAGEDVLLENEEESELCKIKQKMWMFYRAILPLVYYPEKRLNNRVEHYLLTVDRMKRRMKILTTSFIDKLPPCDLELQNELLDVIEKLKEDDVIDKLKEDEVKEKHKENEGNEKLKEDEECELRLTKDNGRDEEFAQVSSLWNQDICRDDIGSVIAPSVGESMSDVQLSDIDKDDLAFKDNAIMKTPDFAAFLKPYLN